jgi:hypothetical protein
VVARSLTGSIVALSGMLVCAHVSAQDARAAAVLAYDQAEALMAAGKVAEACPRYAESQKLDPQLGTLLHLGDCFEKNGQTASAWASFRDAAEVAEQRGDPRKKFAEKRIKALAPRLSRLQINVPHVAELHVERDSIVVGDTLLNSPVPTDPGSHTITASAPGRQSWTGTAIVKADGSMTLITIPDLEKDVSPSPAAPVSSTVAATTQPGDSAQPTTPADTPKDGSLSQRWPALAAGAVGVAGIAVGSVFGLKSMSKKKEAGEHCDGADCRDTEGVTLRKDAIAAGNISTIGFVVGGVGLATGMVLWFVLPSGSSQTTEGRQAGRTRVGLTPSAVTLEHVW